MTEHFTLHPPEGSEAACTCGSPIEAINICGDSETAAIEPCGCRLTPAEVTAAVKGAP